MDSQSSRAVGYVRVSTDEQAREGVSLDVQELRIRAYAQAKGLPLTDVLVDEGVSGKNLNRPALRELLSRCNGESVGHGIVWKLDRLTRRTRDLLTLVDEVFLTRLIEQLTLGQRRGEVTSGIEGVLPCSYSLQEAA